MSDKNYFNPNLPGVRVCGRRRGEEEDGGQIDPPVGQIDTPQKKLPSKSPALFRLITSPQVRRRRPKQLM